MAGKEAGYRNRLFRAVHVEAAKRRIDHDALHDLCVRDFKVHSMSELSDGQLLGLYRQWTGKVLRRRAALGNADWEKAPEALVSGEEINAIAQEFAKRSLGRDSQRNFIRRQLRGRDVIRTQKDYVRVMHAVLAMNTRDGL